MRSSRNDKNRAENKEIKKKRGKRNQQHIRSVSSTTQQYSGWYKRGVHKTRHTRTRIKWKTPHSKQIGSPSKSIGKRRWKKQGIGGQKWTSGTQKTHTKKKEEKDAAEVTSLLLCCCWKYGQSTPRSEKKGVKIVERKDEGKAREKISEGGEQVVRYREPLTVHLSLESEKERSGSLVSPRCVSVRLHCIMWGSFSECTEYMLCHLTDAQRITLTKSSNFSLSAALVVNTSADIFKFSRPSCLGTI